MTRMKQMGRLLVVGTVLMLAAAPAHAINVVIDYTYDTNNFFGAGNPQGATSGAQAKAALNSAASYFSTILNDTFSAIVKPADFHSSVFNGVATWDWKAVFLNPATGAEVKLSNPPIVADEYRIYAGAQGLGGSTAGIGGPGGYETNPGGSGGFTQQELNQINVIDAGFTNQVIHREEASGFANWGGAITFDRDGTTVWHYNHTTSPVGQVTDFYSVAIHELGHALGFGTADEFNALVSGFSFIGGNASATFGGQVPLSADGHWALGTNSTVYGTATAQEAAMDPDILNGTRKFFTTLDAAALKDIGWELVAPPVSPTGDYNGNGKVDAADYVVWRNTNGQSVAAGTGADGSGNGSVGPEDYTFWRGKFGQSAGSGAGLVGSAVPEPSGVVLFALAAIIFGMLYRPTVA